MVNYHESFRNLLNDAVDNTVTVYYESFSEKEDTPCISYMEASNITSAIGNNQKRSEVIFQVKVWAETVEELINISEMIDAKLEAEGYKRSSCFDSSDNGLAVKIIKYTGLSIEWR